MRKMKCFKNLTAIGTAAVLALSLVGCGQSAKTGVQQSETKNAYPQKPITLIVPADAGGDTDLRARLVGRYLEKELGTSVVISNVSGGATSVASIKLKESAPDGYTLLFNHNSLLTNQLFGTTDFGHEDLSIVGSIYRTANVGLITHKNAPEQTFKDVVETLKANPKTIDYATETGGMSYLCVLALQKKLGIEFNIVDAGDAAQRTSAMMGGHIDIMLSNLNTMEDYFKSGDLIPLVCVNSGMDLEIENVPTMKEIGYDFEWPDLLYSIYMPAGTPEDIRKTVEDALKNVSENEEFIKEANDMKATASFMNGADTKAYYDQAKEFYFSFEDVVKESMQ